MKSEIQILKEIQVDSGCSQRDIARATGISLGNVNVLLKRLINNGLIIAEKRTSSSNKYILTLQGKKKWSEAAYRYIMDSYKCINELSDKFDKIIQFVHNNYDMIILLGKYDEIYSLIKGKLVSKGINHMILHSGEEIIKLPFYKEKFFIIWNPEYIDMVNNLELKHINILEAI